MKYHYAIQHPLDDFFNLSQAVFNEFNNQPAFAGRIPIDVHADDDGYTVIANLPGFTADQISIDILEDVVTIKAENASEVVEEDQKTIHRERRHGIMARRFRLPTLLDNAKAEADLADGVLTVYIPKAEAAKPKAIKVKNGKK